MNALEAVKRLGSYSQSLQSDLAESRQTIADLQVQLAEALAQPQQSAEAIAAAQDQAAQAQIDADAAKAKVTELQALVDADAMEDADIAAIVSAVVPAE